MDVQMYGCTKVGLPYLSQGYLHHPWKERLAGVGDSNKKKHRRMSLLDISYRRIK